ncbi:MAG TPA: zf-HC2 domain-containing protein [Terriglobales bacterium]|nr:zf-HC2 domain-containing protein [Terriglobales bacterium]
MVVRCEDVWREISNYVEGDVDPALRAALEDHLRICKNCTAVLNGTRNVIRLYADERLFDLPRGFSQHLHQKLEAHMPGRRGTAFGWMVAFAAAALLIIGFEVGNSSAFTGPALRSQHAQEASSDIPPDLMVVVTDGAKTFHLPGCGVIHNRATEKLISSREALLQGYVPCVRCLRKYVGSVATVRRPAVVPGSRPGMVNLASLAR